MTTTVTLSPNATVQNTGGSTGTGWAPSTGTLHGVLSDATDLTFASGGFGDPGDPAAIAEIGFGTSALPSGSRVVDVTPQVRWVRLSGLTTTNHYDIRDTVGTGAIWSAAAPSAVATQNGPAQARRSNGAQWTQADIDALQLRWAAYNEIADNRLYEVRLLVRYALQPDLTVNGSGTETTSTPTVAWTPSMDPGFPTVERRHVKVFAQAVWSGGGFNPETSTAVWDETEQVSSATSTVVGSPLAAGTDYRRYVKIAAQVNGEAHWSPWRFQEFDVVLASPAVPSIAVFAEDDEARIRIVVTRNAGAAVTDYVQIQRTADGGTTVEDVRGAAFADLLVAGATTTWYDAQTGDGVPWQYRARAISDDAGLTALAVSAFSAWTSAIEWNHQLEACEWRFSSPNRPSLDKWFLVAYGGVPTDVWDRPTGVHSILDSEYPVTVQDVRKKPQGGPLVVSLIDTAELDELLALLTHGGTLLVRAPAGDPWGDRYCTIMRASAPRLPLITIVWRDVAMEFVEVASPSGGIDPDFTWVP